MTQGERHDLALFIDFENIALGLRGRTDAHFDIQKVLQRLLEIGNVLVKRAYADWSRFGSYTKPFHEAAIELIEIPRRGDSGKNSADIRLCVDAMDLCYAKEHIDTFVIVSGDSDFSPLVSKLRENGKRVIGLGLRGSTSNLLVSNCDEFIFYETLDRHVAPQPAGPQDVRRDKESLMKLVAQTVGALLREGRDPIQTSLVKDTIKRMQPSFNESDYGYRAFTEVLGDAQSRKLILMREDPRSGTYVITLPSGNAAANGPASRDHSHARQPVPAPGHPPAPASAAASTVAPPAAVQAPSRSTEPKPVPSPLQGAAPMPAPEPIADVAPSSATKPAVTRKPRARGRSRSSAATARRRAPSKGKAGGGKD